ncbi:MAG: type II secretion system F family protein [Planctomycetaceae bacterium]
MQNFHYLAIDAFGQQQEGTLAARDLDDAARILREERGWTVRDLQAIDDEVAPKKPATSAREQEALAGMLAGLTEGNFRFRPACGCWERNWPIIIPGFPSGCSSGWRGWRPCWNRGSSLEESLKMQGAPADLIAAVEAGVRSGNPGQALSQYVTYLKGSSSLRLQLILGILYPLFLFVTSGFLFLGLMLLIVPGFNNIFQGFGIELPFLTVSVLNFSSFLVNYGKLLCWLVLGLLALYGCLLCFLPEYYRRVLLHAIPVVGPISEAVSMAVVHAHAGVSDG